MTEREIMQSSPSTRAVWLAGASGLLGNATAVLILAGAHARLSGVSIIVRWFPFLAQEPISPWWLWSWFVLFLFLSLIEIPLMALALRAMSRAAVRRPLLLTVGVFVFFPAVYAWMNWVFTAGMPLSLIIAGSSLLRFPVALVMTRGTGRPQA